MNQYIFQSNYFLRILKGDYHPFTPNTITIDENHIEYRRRNFHLFSVDTENLHFQNITGITIDKHLFGATIRINSTGNDPIIVFGFWKSTANKIKDICSTYISSNTQKGTNEALIDAISNASGGFGKSDSGSIADEIKELKQLFDNGVLTEQEFIQLKKKLIDNL